METSNHTSPSQATARNMRNITPPSRQDGIGNALRAAYDQAVVTLPDDMKNLLARLG